jgi:hypothetical protein
MDDDEEVIVELEDHTLSDSLDSGNLVPRHLRDRRIDASKHERRADSCAEKRMPDDL